MHSDNWKWTWCYSQDQQLHENLSHYNVISIDLKICWLVTIATISLQTQGTFITMANIFHYTVMPHGNAINRVFELKFHVARVSIVLHDILPFSHSFALAPRSHLERWFRVKSYSRTLLVNNNMYKFMIKPCERTCHCYTCMCYFDVYMFEKPYAIRSLSVVAVA